MTTQFRLEHDFPSISLALFEKYLNHPKLNAHLQQMPAFRSRDMVEQQDLDNGDKLWKFKVVAGGNLPSSVKKIVSEEMFTWWETSRFIANEHCINWNIEPLFAKEKFEGKGTWQLIKSGRGTKRIIEGEIVVKIPFVGKVVETFIVSELKRNYDIEPQIQEDFYKLMKKEEG